MVSAFAVVTIYAPTTRIIFTKYAKHLLSYVQAKNKT